MKKYFSGILIKRPGQKIKRIIVFKKTSEELEYGSESIIYEELEDKRLGVDSRYQTFDANIWKRVIKTSKPAEINQIFLFKITKLRLCKFF